MTGIYARPCEDLSLELVHRESGKVVEKLPIRLAQEEHRAFILATWVRSYASHARKAVPRSAYAEGEAKLAERFWPKTFVVTSPDDDYTIHAWICCEPGHLYHVYVIPELRRKGIADSLVRKLVGGKVQYARPWPYDVPRNWTFNPYLWLE